MAAPTNAANVKKALANSEPSTHGTKRHKTMSALRSLMEAKRTSFARYEHLPLLTRSGTQPDSITALSPWVVRAVVRAE